MTKHFVIDPTFTEIFPEAVIGLEVHVQLKTRSKMFTRVATGFGSSFWPQADSAKAATTERATTESFVRIDISPEL